MDNSKNLTGFGAIAVSVITTIIVIGLGWLFGAHDGTASVPGAAITSAQQSAIEHNVANIILPLLPKSGAISSPSLGAWFSVGDVIHDGWSCNFDFTGTATSTACGFLSPPTTSTFAMAPALRIITEPYVNTWKIGKSALPATYTVLLAQDLVSSAQGIIHATTTNTTLTDGVIPPNSYVSCGIATTTAVNANFNATGRCELIFREL